MTLTPEYQYLGRSAALKSQNGSHSYYLLLYGATSGLPGSGSHHVSIKLRLACATGSSFYGFSTSGAASVGGQSAFSWSWGLVPNAPWNTGTLTEGGITYTAWTDLREGYAIISTGYGAEKTVDLSGSFLFCDGTSGYLPQKNQQVAVSVSCVLPAVAGLGKPSCAATCYLGATLPITVSGYPGMTHAIYYRFGALTETIALGVTDSTSWTPPLDLAAQIPNDVSGTAEICCNTYAGADLIGTQTTPVTLLVPESVKPTVTAAVTDASGAEGRVGCLVQNYSKLKVVPNAQGIYGSTIRATAVLLDGKAYSGGILTESGSHTLTVTATDSRGRTASFEKTITVVAYKAPTLKLSASRCTADGTPDEAGGYAKITVTGAITELAGENEAALTLYWGSSSQSYGNVTGCSKIVAADVNSTLAIRATLSDKLITTERSMTLSTGYATLDLLAGGKGIAFGKAATREGFDCAMRAYFPGGISDIGGGVYVPNSAVNDVFNGGFYRWDVAKEQTPFANATMLVVPRAKDTSATQIAFCNAATYKNIIAYRTATTSDPGEWMFFNPYLSLGNEYLTIERWKGKSVYKKLISFGTLPASGEKNVDTGLAFAGYEIVGYSLGLLHSSGSYVYFMTPNLTFGFYKSGDNWRATAEVGSDLSAYTATVEIRYVKKG